MRAAIYRRVSSLGQAKEDKFSLDDQLGRCTQWCEQRGYQIVADFREVHTGADLDARPKMSELRRMISAQQIDVMVLTTLDRLARDQIHQTVVLYESDKYDVRVETTEESYEDSPAGKIMRTFAGIFAEMEQQKITDRTTRGIKERVRQGLMIPGRVPLYGYSWADEKKSRYVENPDTVEIARRIWKEAASGKPLQAIASSLTADGIPTPGDYVRRQKNDPNDPPRGNAWARMTIWNILSNPAYYGQHSAFRWDHTKTRREIDPLSKTVTKVGEISEREVGNVRVVLPDVAPAVISKELAGLVRERLAQNKLEASRKNKNPEFSLLCGGYVKCGACGKNLHVDYRGARDEREAVYRCTRSLRKNAAGEHLCIGASIAIERLDTMVWEDVLTILCNPAYIKEEVKRYMDQLGNQDVIEAINQQIKYLELQETNIRKAIRLIDTQTGIEGLVADLKGIATQKQKAQRELEQREQDRLYEEAARKRMERVTEWSQEFLQVDRILSYDERRTILYGLNIRVTVFPRGTKPRYIVSTGRGGQLVLPTGGVDRFDSVPVKCSTGLTGSRPYPLYAIDKDRSS